MKRRITLSIAVGLIIVLVSLTSSDSKADAQNNFRRVADSGFIPLGPDQVLRLTVVSVDGELGGGIYGVRFRQIDYAQGACGGGGVCKHTAASQITSPTMTVAPNEAVWIDIDRAANSTGTRAIVLSNSRNMRVTAMIFKTTTGEVDAFFDIWPGIE